MGRVIQAINEHIYELVKVFVFPIYLELPYANAASPHKEHDQAHVGKQALGDKEIGSSQKKIMEVRSRIFPLDFSGFAL